MVKDRARHFLNRCWKDRPKFHSSTCLAHFTRRDAPADKALIWGLSVQEYEPRSEAAIEIERLCKEMFKKRSGK